MNLHEHFNQENSIVSTNRNNDPNVTTPTNAKKITEPLITNNQTNDLDMAQQIIKYSKRSWTIIWKKVRLGHDLTKIVGHARGEDTIKVVQSRFHFFHGTNTHLAILAVTNNSIDVMNYKTTTPLTHHYNDSMLDSIFEGKGVMVL